MNTTNKLHIYLIKIIVVLTRIPEGYAEVPERERVERERKRDILLLIRGSRV